MKCEADDTIPYAKGSYNVFNDEEQWIRLSEGCPHYHPYCRESFEIGDDWKVFKIPQIIRNNVKILDMNLLCKIEAKEILRKLGGTKVHGRKVSYELICGIDYRFLTKYIASLLKRGGFVNIRLAWDGVFGLQKEIKTALELLKKAGYKSKLITVFMICNWKITYEENMRKLDLCKVWNVKVADCYFDNQISPKFIPIHWTIEQMRDFRKRVRKHNQLVRFGIDPEYKKKKK